MRLKHLRGTKLPALFSSSRKPVRGKFARFELARETIERLGGCSHLRYVALGESSVAWDPSQQKVMRVALKKFEKSPTSAGLRGLDWFVAASRALSHDSPTPIPFHKVSYQSHRDRLVHGSAPTAMVFKRSRDRGLTGLFQGEPEMVNIRLADPDRLIAVVVSARLYGRPLSDSCPQGPLPGEAQKPSVADEMAFLSKIATTISDRICANIKFDSMESAAKSLAEAWLRVANFRTPALVARIGTVKLEWKPSYEPSIAKLVATARWSSDATETVGAAESGDEDQREVVVTLDAQHQVDLQLDVGSEDIVVEPGSDLSSTNDALRAADQRPNVEHAATKHAGNERPADECPADELSAFEFDASRQLELRQYHDGGSGAHLHDYIESAVMNRRTRFPLFFFTARWDKDRVAASQIPSSKELIRRLENVAENASETGLELLRRLWQSLQMALPMDPRVNLWFRCKYKLIARDVNYLRIELRPECFEPTENLQERRCSVSVHFPKHVLRVQGSNGRRRSPRFCVQVIMDLKNLQASPVSGDGLLSDLTKAQRAIRGVIAPITNRRLISYADECLEALATMPRPLAGNLDFTHVKVIIKRRSVRPRLSDKVVREKSILPSGLQLVPIAIDSQPVCLPDLNTGNSAIPTPASAPSSHLGDGLECTSSGGGLQMLKAGVHDEFVPLGTEPEPKTTAEEHEESDSPSAYQAFLARHHIDNSSDIVSSQYRLLKSSECITRKTGFGKNGLEFSWHVRHIPLISDLRPSRVNHLAELAIARAPGHGLANLHSAIEELGKVVFRDRYETVALWFKQYWSTVPGHIPQHPQSLERTLAISLSFPDASSAAPQDAEQSGCVSVKLTLPSLHIRTLGHHLHLNNNLEYVRFGISVEGVLIPENFINEDALESLNRLLVHVAGVIEAVAQSHTRENWVSFADRTASALLGQPDSADFLNITTAKVYLWPKYADQPLAQAYKARRKRSSAVSEDLPGSGSPRPLSSNDLQVLDNRRTMIALGSNVGDRLGAIETACNMIDQDDDMHIVETSPLYETQPMYVQEQESFLNGICEIETELSPIELLDKLQAIENGLGRIKLIDKGPRNIDLDILTHRDEEVETERLIIPHALMLEREFVLRPLCDTAGAAFVHPKTKRRVTDHLSALPPSPMPMYPVTPLAPNCASIRSLDPDGQTSIMSILNVTPDSFSDGGVNQPTDLSKLKSTILSHIAGGARIIDIGGQSSRPNAPDITGEEEIARVLPAIELIKCLPEAANIAISIDTYRASVAEAAVKAGAHIVNDISAGMLDEDMLPTIAKLGCTYIMMHMRGTPATMQSEENTSYSAGIIEGISAELQSRLRAAQGAGIRRWRIILDPGIGFSKTLDQNLQILKGFETLRRSKELSTYPWLVGTSRKGFIGKITGVEDPTMRAMGTAVTVASAVQNGADIVRVHDVVEMAQVVRMTEAISRS